MKKVQKRAETVEEWEIVVRPEVMKIMLESEYGYLPEEPENVEFEIKNTDD